ncbi:MAG: bifunctional adenosylcobinamide kinase/adenosylcobinamide-phosphate guanylyltransferase [Anaerolineales bacterium]|jgi:adenosylcobinamide kinase/adenosylcobinamide-phosphate guanylyltransferase|nr:bifunctional adenosylcobinamide kinase/adenosylcobinamide-phosphate guanylyltransferase [Anaerolineales bacterium]
MANENHPLKLTLILGGARSGKSTFAEGLASRSGEEVVYIATAQALDEEMAQRIATHQQKRPQSWQTLEIPLNVGQRLLDNPPQADVIVLDCLTLLVSNALLTAAPDVDQPDERAAQAQVTAEIEALEAAIQSIPAAWIVVSNEVGMGLVPPYPLGRIYRDLLGWANQRLARRADCVIFMLAGLPMRLKPDLEA